MIMTTTTTTTTATTTTMTPKNVFNIILCFPMLMFYDQIRLCSERLSLLR